MKKSISSGCAYKLHDTLLALSFAMRVIFLAMLGGGTGAILAHDYEVALRIWVMAALIGGIIQPAMVGACIGMMNSMKVQEARVEQVLRCYIVNDKDQLRRCCMDVDDWVDNPADAKVFDDIAHALQHISVCKLSGVWIMKITKV